MALEQDIAELVQASNNLTGVVDNKMQSIDARIASKEAEVDNYLASARGENAIYRQTKNQFGNLTGDSLDYFAKNGGITISVSHYRSIVSGTVWASRDAEEQEILTKMGRHGVQHFQPEIRVMKMAWSGYDSTKHSSYTMFPSPIGNNSTYCTVASYAKLLSGDIGGQWLQGVNNEWGLCGTHYAVQQGRYLHAHPYAYSPSGEVLFIWPAIVSGRVPLDRENPKWGYYPSLSGDNAFDVTAGA
ncbi:hypothetical protein SG34_025710 [Thalassomonas viridans]|uniref:Uncharacterized protein n=1 Tax=Thalassomonas viridans TaxID=137584 RepID=A0AAE9Z0P6_9GAMM|nr:hypothetical protein [Thalassomonas viridans]WDE04686.1 hypothetical protein SG34_025710 [Thalassomonas viridans]